MQRNLPTWRAFYVAAALVWAPPGSTGMAAAEDSLAGPVAARLVSVIDGDTLRVWLGLDVAVDVRIRGIDAPEVRGRCPQERTMAAKATDALRRAVAQPALSLRNVGEDKYFGRVVADVVSADGTDLAEAMLVSGLARPYDGGRRSDWCAASASAGG